MSETTVPPSMCLFMVQESHLRQKLGPNWHLSGLWGLLNNAGIADTSIPITWRTVQDYQHSNSVNLYGLIRMTLKFLPLIKQEGGRVVNTGAPLFSLFYICVGSWYFLSFFWRFPTPLQGSTFYMRFGSRTVVHFCSHNFSDLFLKSQHRGSLRFSWD